MNIQYIFLNLITDILLIINTWTQIKLFGPCKYKQEES